LLIAAWFCFDPKNYAFSSSARLKDKPLVVFPW
jgi:hypothetical protein